MNDSDFCVGRAMTPRETSNMARLIPEGAKIMIGTQINLMRRICPTGNAQCTVSHAVKRPLSICFALVLRIIRRQNVDVGSECDQEVGLQR